MKVPPILRGVLTLVSVCAAAGTALGQDSQEAMIQKLIARVEALEREVAALKQSAAGTSAAPPEPVVAAAGQDGR